MLPAGAGARSGVRPRVKRRRVAINAVTVMSVSAAIVATMALPSYAVDPRHLHAGGLGTAAVRSAVPQSFAVPTSARPAVAARDVIGATTVEELLAERARQKAEARAFAEAKQRALEAATAGEPVEQLSVAARPEPAAAPAADAQPAEAGSIVEVARRYLGVPYIFGGASPAGFDCSGLVMYVYAQFGVSLPHSSMRQGADGTRVAEPAPGDLIVIDGGNHIGIYTGGGNMIDAPMPGRVVNERPIYTADHYFVRY
jgi:cell wall-associated NlpC family hydrolase